MGGDRHHPLVVAIARGLADRGIAALRLDLTDPDPAVAAPLLAEAATALREDHGEVPVLMAGYSWGAAVTSLTSVPALVAKVLVAPPASMPLGEPEPDGAPLLVLVPAHDQLGGPEAIGARTATWPATTLEVVEGADHFLAGAVERIAARAVAWLVDQST
jgi:alpha/beta superfamily hydrolase